ncbi:hypothetical protein Phum_PHUM456110 [Pediculus humanus corporis]|uniref:Uncharacterized protein n=1 Tax=Pediculus humanus subsp. corporis TaxID=121224 RepID=E0VUV9_PEDHC|nr:uncharacterized protein Phum_PHUM456110 [Pediculus humanus corporis]EEB17165.1 hypothetical protein Phum_PHUM456110 [Pediculus humanus corporis]
MYVNYQPWVIKTYGDLSRTKTITLKKRERILKILRGEEQLSAENSKFRFWVRNKGFRMEVPHGYVTKPADNIIGRNGLENGNTDLYVPTGHKPTLKEEDGGMNEVGGRG